MTTQQTTWIEYTGSKEQIAEMKKGFIFRDVNGQECNLIYYGKDFVSNEHLEGYLKGCEVTHYWIIPDDPLREIKIRHAQTCQPVWVRYKLEWDRRSDTIETDCTTTPDWNIPGAEYCFTPFEEEV